MRTSSAVEPTRGRRNIHDVIGSRVTFQAGNRCCRVCTSCPRREEDKMEFGIARKFPDAIEADAKKKMSSFDGPSLEALESASA